MITLRENLILKIKKSFTLTLSIKFRAYLSAGHDENSSVCKNITREQCKLTLFPCDILKIASIHQLNTKDRIRLRMHTSISNDAQEKITITAYRRPKKEGETREKPFLQ